MGKSATARTFPLASNSIMRGTWDGNQLTDVRDIFVADDVDMEMSRIAFGKDGMLYMTIGGPGTGPPASLDRPPARQRLRGQDSPHDRRGRRPEGQSVRRQAGFKPVDLHDGPPHATRSDDQPVQRRGLGRRAGAEWRRRGQRTQARQELRVAHRQLRFRLSRATIRHVLEHRVRGAATVLDASHRALWHGVLHGRPLPELEAQPLRRRHA
jgi:hypothetical protein